jgi:hypothetical protein
VLDFFYLIFIYRFFFIRNFVNVLENVSVPEREPGRETDPETCHQLVNQQPPQEPFNEQQMDVNQEEPPQEPFNEQMDDDEISNNDHVNLTAGTSLAEQIQEIFKAG